LVSNKNFLPNKFHIIALKKNQLTAKMCKFHTLKVENNPSMNINKYTLEFEKNV